MYACSEKFHQAVAAGNRQKALLIFNDCVFTDEDISVENGIDFHDYFNTEEDLSIGQALSNDVSFTLFNDDRLLNNYEFGEFVATLGVLYDTTTYTQTGSVMVDTKYATYVGMDTYPFITRNGNALEAKPTFAVKAILGYADRVYAFGSDGRAVVYDDRNGNNITSSYPVNAFMRNKASRWNGKGIYYNKDTRILKICEAGKKEWYEFVPLGVFIADRPNAPDMIQIDMVCHDRMEKFDKDMPSASQLGIGYPTTVMNLFARMCSFAGVPYSTVSFINSSAVLTEEPEGFDNASMRDVIRWIAEAAASNAKFNRDGILEMRWIKDTSQRYTTTGYQEYNPYWYATKKVDRLMSRDTQESVDYERGSGNNVYLIQDNPLLKGVN